MPLTPTVLGGRRPARPAGSARASQDTGAVLGRIHGGIADRPRRGAGQYRALHERNTGRHCGGLPSAGVVLKRTV
jgi:Ser/Thr protein kinase RdoA (MazF antagonist)